MTNYFVELNSFGLGVCSDSPKIIITPKNIKINQNKCWQITETTEVMIEFPLEVLDEGFSYLLDQAGTPVAISPETFKVKGVITLSNSTRSCKIPNVSLLPDIGYRDCPTNGRRLIIPFKISLQTLQNFILSI